jgi:hypothetical protein
MCFINNFIDLSLVLFVYKIILFFLIDMNIFINKILNENILQVILINSTFW